MPSAFDDAPQGRATGRLAVAPMARLHTWRRDRDVGDGHGERAVDHASGTTVTVLSWLSGRQAAALKLRAKVDAIARTPATALAAAHRGMAHWHPEGSPTARPGAAAVAFSLTTLDPRRRRPVASAAILHPTSVPSRSSRTGVVRVLDYVTSTGAAFNLAPRRRESLEVRPRRGRFERHVYDGGKFHDRVARRLSRPDRTDIPSLRIGIFLAVAGDCAGAQGIGRNTMSAPSASRTPLPTRSGETTSSCP
jgi:hypothetical protein